VLKIHEGYTAGGAQVVIHLRRCDEGLEIVDDEGAFPLPAEALARVMARYGSPLDVDASLVPVDALDLGDGRVLRHIRHLARFDVIARDYLVLDVPGDESLCALATSVAAALGHLGRRAAGVTPA
jgi:hypothetical protein